MKDDILNVPADQIPEVLAKLEQSGDIWHRPLFMAAAQKMLGLMCLTAGGRVPKRFLDPARRAPLVITLDDDGWNCVGPTGFQQAARLMKWAGYVMLHGTGGKPEHYVIAVQSALLYRRLLLVECRGDNLPAWIDLKKRIAPKTPGLILSTPPGAPPHMGEMRPAQAGAVVH
jgi:hypothetical protein